MRKAVATVSLSGTLRQKLEAISAAGFEAIELFEPDFVNFNGSARELRSLMADLGLAVDLYQPFRDFEGMPEELFKRNLERAERKFDVMQELGVSTVLVCSNTSPASLGDYDRSAAQLRAMAERAAARGLRIGYEALAWGRWVNLYGQAWDIVQRADHPSLGLILDSFHTLALNDDPSGIADIPGDRIFFVQMADAPWMAMDVLQWARHHRNFPGQGQLAVTNFFEQALRAGYTGTLSLEIFNDVFRYTPNRRTALDAMRSLLYLESEVRKSLEQSAPAGRAVAQRVLSGVPLFSPPPAPTLDGFSFVEFAVDGAAGQALGESLEQLGFARYGAHRTKDVTLYRQGDVQLIVNAQAGTTAREFFDRQGPSVCAIGLGADDPTQAAAHAEAFLSARSDSARRRDELELPAIVAPGGTVVHFVPQHASVEADFVPAATPGAASGVGLTAIDHVAMGLSNEQFDTWTLFARAVLGLEPGASLELADPYGLIRSSGIANASRSVRFVLNVSLSDRTRSARQVSAAPAGASVHHIALRCDDVFETVAKLRERGVRFVPISANYYDDLIARLDIGEDLVRRMQSLDILFDASAEGQYLHAYTEPFQDRFFFEVVQRKQYDGYGAVNAPARMAAQEYEARK